MSGQSSARPFALGVLVTAVVVIAVAGATLAAQGVFRFTATGPQPVTIPPLLVLVERGSLRDVVPVGAQVVPSTRVEVTATGVVTRPGSGTGSALKSGELIGVVNERPIFLLQGNTPLFRDLKKGDSGRDVAALQSGLIALHYVLADGEIRSSTFGWTTARAVYDFYSDRSFAPVDAGGNPRTGAQVSSTGVPKTEFLMTPQVPLTPLAACGTVGQMADGPLCILTGTPFALTLQVPLAEAERIKQDMPVRRAGALVGTVKDRITEPSPTADAGKDSGGDEGGQSQQGESNSSTTPFSVTPAKGVMVDTTLAGSLEVVVAEVTDIAIVDAVAIRGTPQAPWVELVDGRRLDVTVGLCVSGRCEVNDIEPGTEVSVPRSTSETPG